MQTARKYIYDPPGDILPILYEDGDILVINKPSGLLSVPGRAETHKDCLQSRIKSEYPNALTVHRLDLETSGLIIMALNTNAQKNLNKQFEARSVKKTYIADIWGIPSTKDGTVDLPLICDWPNRPRQKVDHDIGKPSVTHWQTLEQTRTGMRVLLTPVTGRSHQLRVHMQAIGHPIIGDSLYAHEQAFHAANRLHLHALKVGFKHPGTDKDMFFETKIPFPIDDEAES